MSLGPSTRSLNGGNLQNSIGTIGSTTGLSIQKDQVFDGVRKTVVKLTSVSVTMTDGTTNGSIGSVKLYDFPEGAINVHCGATDLTLTAGAGGIGDTAALKHSVGSAAEATNDTLDSVQANIVPSTSLTLAAGTGTKQGISTAAAHLDGRAAAAAAYLNLGVADAGSSANDTVTVSGTVTLIWTPMGD